jgi:hypothetical protein
MIAACSSADTPAPKPTEDSWQKRLQEHLSKQPSPSVGPKEDPDWDRRLKEYLEKQDQRLLLKVETWTESALVLEGSREAPLAELSKLPPKSSALTEAVSRGVELQRARVYALVRVHFWQSDEPRRTELKRVDLSHLLVFLGEGESRVEAPAGLRKKGGTFTDLGWRVEEFDMFQAWEKVHFGGSR